MYKKTAFFFIGILLALNCFCQKEYARKVVDTLASPYMGGRGYVDSGNYRAAKYINKQFKDIGLRYFDSSYFQKFEYPINTYPYHDSVFVDDKLAIPGQDYIILPSSPAVGGIYPVEKFYPYFLSDSVKIAKFFIKNHTNSFIVLDDSGMAEGKEKGLWPAIEQNSFNAIGIINLRDKLTEETSQEVNKYVTLDALRNSPFAHAKWIIVDIKNKFIPSFPTQNLIGYIKGSVQPDSFIVFTAHYDHLGKMGNIYFPGANDNASGVAMLLSLAKYYSAHPEGLKYSIAFMAFSGEEVGLLGSKYYTEHPLFPLSKIKFLVNMDIMGTGDEGITVVNGTVYEKAFKDMVMINDSLHLLKLIKPRGETENSDHYYFYQNHVPSFFIYTMGGIKAYHDIYDRRETLPLTKFDEVYNLLIKFMEDIDNNRF